MVPDDASPVDEFTRAADRALASARSAHRWALAALIVNAINVLFLIGCAVARHYYPDHPFFTKDVTRDVIGF